MLTSNFKYDAADQLTEASVPSASSVLKEFVYRYDKAGNRSSEQIDTGVAAATINNLNQVTGLSPNGPIRFEGTLNEPGTVTVNGIAAVVASDNSFKVDVPLNAGSNTVTVVAKDPADNTTTESYSVPVDSGSSRSLTYDLNGNMLSNGAGQTYTWDSADRMTKITYTGGATTELTYDGLGRRVKIVEKNSGGSVTSEKRFVWVDLEIAEERDGSNNLSKRFYAQGVMVSSDEFYYTRDHLGSIREFTDDTGEIEARYDYDPYGRVTKVSGSGDADFRFTGHYYHATSGLHLAVYRAYDSGLGRWLSRDPIAEGDGPNLYAYVSSDPLNNTDPAGLARRRGESVSACMDRFLRDYYGPRLAIADDLGFWGLVSGGLAATVGKEALSKAAEKAAERGLEAAARDAQIAGALRGGSMGARLQAAERAAGRVAALRVGLKVVGRATAVIGIGATAFSLGARAAALGSCAAEEKPPCKNSR